MTFYEAALRVLEREGKPLHVSAIIEIAVRENLLSHVGKSPEEVMQSRLLAMARRRSDRKVTATALQTYALADWGLPEDPAALEPVVQEPPGASEPPLRPRERHPIPSPDKVRVAGRGERPRKRREDEIEDRRKRRRISGLAEFIIEQLTASGAMSAVDLAAAARDKEIVSEDLGAEGLLQSLRDHNKRRQELGRRPAFNLGTEGMVSLERAAIEAPAAIEAEGGPLHALPVAEVRREERGPGAARLLAQAADHRRHILRLLRRRLGELDLPAFERAALALLEAHGYRDPRLVRRTGGATYVQVRKRDGLIDLRYLVRLVRGTGEITREDVDGLRKDVTAQGVHLGLLLSAGEASRDARLEAQNTSQPVVILLSGDVLADRFAEKRLGATVTTVEILDLDEEFIRRCREKPVAPEAERRREGRDGGREPREGREGREGRDGRDGREREGGERRERSDRSERNAPAEAPAGPTGPAAAAASGEPVPAAPPAPVEAPVDESVRRAREEEARIRLTTHERIEAAEIQSRSFTRGPV